MPRTPTISFHSQTLTCPLHLSVIQSTLPGVNHHPCWPAITVCSQNEYWPPAALQPELLTLTIMHLASLQPPFALPAFTFRSLFTTPAFMDSQVHHSGYFMYPHPPLLMPPPYSIPSSLCRLLSNYFWYLTWVTVFNNMFKNKRALLKGWRGRGLLKGQFVGRPGEQACLHDGHSFDGAHGSTS